MKSLFQFILLSSTFTSLAIAAALPAEKRTVSAVIGDLNNIESSIKSLDNTIKSVPQEGIVAALTIEEDIDNIISMLQKTHSDIISTGPISSADANSVLSAITSVEPVVIEALNDFVAQKPEVVKLNSEISGIVQLAETELINLQSNTSVVEDALFSAAPASLKPTGSVIASAIAGAFETAIAAYAST